MRPSHRFLLLLLGTLLSCWNLPEAHAQSVSIDRQGFRIRRLHDRPTSEDPDALSRQDCLDDNPQEQDYNVETKSGARTYLQFSVALRDVNNRMVLEIWASLNADCTDQDQRKNSGNCQRVYHSNPSGLVDDARVYPRVVVSGADVIIFQPDDTDGAGAGVEPYPDEDVCNRKIDDQYSFYILLFKGDQVISSALWEGTRVDTSAPPPPVSLAANPGDENIFLEWDVPTEDEQIDTVGFAFYCVESDPTALGMGGANGGNPACPQNVLVAGELPSVEAQALAQCGDVRGKGSRNGQISDVDNGVDYAVAVAARDLVNNRGALTEISCARPEDVTTFFERYRSAGGKGGGGFCAWSIRTPGSLLWVALVIGGLLSLLRHRARARRS